MIDTHIHLYAEEYDADRDHVIAEALAMGVQKFLMPAIDSECHAKMFALEAAYPQQAIAMMGLHPCYVKSETYQHELQLVHQQLQSRKFCAIGEIGIDLHWDRSTLGIQIEAFEQQIDWAIQYQLPIAIHARESMAEILEVLTRKQHPQLTGVLHCYSGDLPQAQRLVEMGFYLGIGGVVTFKNGKIDQFLSEIPLEKLLLETDGPYLAPVPYRGKRNEPKYLKQVQEKLCSIYQKTPQEISEITNRNAEHLFLNH
jgi:TatD DNase family protein